MGEKIKCQYCGQELDPVFFYDNENPYHKNGKTSFCKRCCEEISQEIMGRAGDLENGIKELCFFFHYPFDSRAFSKIAKSTGKRIKKDFNYIDEYVDIIRGLKISPERYLDFEGNLPKILDIINGERVDLSDIKILTELQNEWGVQDSLEDYVFLENEYNKYALNEKDLSSSTITVLRFLCLALLDVHKARVAGRDTTADEKRVMEYYKRLKLDDFKFDEKRTEVEKLIENWAYIEENIEPLDWVKDNLEDICHFRDDNDDIMRCIANKVVGSKDYPELTSEDLKK